MQILGVDIGGTGIKGAIVETDNGELLTERYRILTPQSGKPRPIAKTVKEIVDHFQWSGPIGCGFPAAIRQGIVLTASNIHKTWIGTNVESLFAETTGCLVKVINDADAAGLAEMTGTLATTSASACARESGSRRTSVLCTRLSIRAMGADAVLGWTWVGFQKGVPYACQRSCSGRSKIKSSFRMI